MSSRPQVGTHGTRFALGSSVLTDLGYWVVCSSIFCLTMLTSFLLTIADTMTDGVWAELAEVRDPELQRLAKALPSTVLHSRADSTVAKYGYAFQRWKSWARARDEVPVFPVHAVHFALYLQHLSEKLQSWSAVQEAVNAVSWVHQLSGLEPVTQSAFVQATVAGLKRKLAKPKAKKEPVTVDMLAALVDSLGESPSLSDVRLAAICLLAFAAFLRFDEIAKLRCCDVAFSDASMSVHIASSKTDQYRLGDSVLVARTGSPTCPVAMLERYFAMAALSHSSQLALFRGITCTKSGERLRASGKLSYTRMRELFLAKWKELGFDPAQFGLHSLRAGGATAAANAGVAERLFKRHGRWRSESAKDGYVKDSQDALLSVSASLKL